MSLLRHDGFTRRQRHEPASGRRAQVGGALLVILGFASVALLVLSKAEHHAVRALRTETIEAITPLLGVLSQPAAYIERLRRNLDTYRDVLAELERTKQEKQRLEQWQWRARQLEAEIDQLRKLLNGVKDRGFTFATARVVAEGRGPFTRSVLLNVGASQGIRNGFAVVDSNGFVGRVVETSANAARVLLLADFNSRIPVLVGSSAERAIIRGKGSGRPVLEFLPGSTELKVGDAIVTSGQDGLLPKGLRIGRVASTGPSPQVEPSAQLAALDFVSILFFEAPGLELANGGLLPRQAEAIASSKP